MTAADRPQIVLITPPEFDPAVFPDRLAAVLDGVDTACLRLALATRDEDRVARAADALRAVAHARDVAIVIESHLLLVERHGLDGVHLPDGARSLRQARKTLSGDAIVGAFCRNSRHDGMTAGEAGADYVAFGPLGQTALGDGAAVPFDLFDFWSEAIEIPVVAEGTLTPALIGQFGPVTDFFAIGDEIWRSDDPLAALRQLLAPLG